MTYFLNGPLAMLPFTCYSLLTVGRKSKPSVRKLALQVCIVSRKYVKYYTRYFRCEILRVLNSGSTLIVDRYAFSGVAFSAAKVSQIDHAFKVLLSYLL